MCLYHSNGYAQFLIKVAMLRRLFKRPIKTLTSLEAYALWSKEYHPEPHNPLMQIEQEAMLRLLPPLKGKVVLDLACGTGRYAKLALERQASKVIGVDNSLDMLQKAYIRQVAQATCEAIPLASQSVDVVLCGLALGHLPELSASAREIRRVLKPNGVALVSDFHPFQHYNGAKRTFKTIQGQVYAVENYAHLYSEYHRAFTQVGFTIQHVIEPTYQDKPVVLVLSMS
jgi:malonyl-CoA O-methyltransferase